ncbi:cadmium-translocating P-type ATPase [Sphingomonas sp. MAH-20]|uniref:Cadmium-translocating P-type ATPase n=1 Tax=Sphingomonas horti TaxID=2682842 RepID=A0A6I4IZY9_9SPHN|nr:MULTISPECIES: heavy metal translocating P-type ATPase [Sphingomonas]MBA2919968.1 cadmium-translocating P-type ATPase [Sphingomonas sp. CGMCC 1.13658]MVO77850.1 cadmium-translocating P-type ATPase [Sphingomonas horti]
MTAIAGDPTRTLFAVPGMRCAGCIAKLESGLAPVPGIASARVNFTARQVAIDHAPGLQLPDLQAAIAKLGFEAQPIQGNAPAPSESRDLLKATAVAGFASMNVMLLSVSVWSGAAGATRDLFHLLSALIAIPTVAYSGRPFFKSAWAALSHGRTNMDVPISIGVLLVTALSLFETLTSGAHAYFDGAVMLLFFLLVGRVLDSVMRDRARDGVAALLKQTAPGALTLKPDGTTEWRAADTLAPGMRMIVAAGERLAADGVVEAGASSLDLALLTGESAPQPVGEGAKVHAGTLNLDAPLTVRITAAGPDTAIADIARLMEQAGQARSRYVRIADRAARLYAPAVHTLALLSFFGWMLAGAGWHHSLLIAAAVLIITCPCALGLAVPAAQIVAAGTLMRSGVLIKDGSALERLAEVDRALFDKTGTLTLGRPQPVDLDRLRPVMKPAVLALAQGSRHPLSAALRTALEQQGVTPAPVEQIREEPGFGMRGRYLGAPVSLGRPGADEADSQMAVAFTMDGLEPCLLHFEDAIRPGTGATLARLDRLGIRGSIASGDRAESVAPVAQALNLAAQTDMRPEDKLAAIGSLAATGAKVLMVGDGLNDGPALAAGHASMAPASASDVGQTAADAVFMGDSLAPIATTIMVARRTMRIVRQNFAIAISYNMVAIPLALLGLVTPLVAALAMSGSSIIVVGNALRLRRVPQ